MTNPIATMYLDWVNDFLTVAKFAQHYGISLELANLVIEEGRELHEASVVKAK